MNQTADAAPSTDFTTLVMAPALLRGVEALGYNAMTPIQARALPELLAGRDLIAQAPTGSGKTAAFGIALLHALDLGAIRTQALVLCPTRELASQVATQLRKLAVGLPNLKVSLLCGGMALEPQLSSLEHAPHVVVGTPGRIQELLKKNVLQLRQVRMLVLDEADRMLDMGFEDQLADIVKRLPRERQGALFSATLPQTIRTLARAALRDPVEVTVDAGVSAPAIEQVFVEVDAGKRTQTLAALLLEQGEGPVVVFCNMRRDVDDVAASLAHYGFDALALHGDMEQRDRDEILVRFANRSATVLVASDVAARGLDIDDIACVINHELPTDADTYTHRIGRTGRAGKAGLAISLCTVRELPRANAIAAASGASLRWRSVTPLGGRPPRVPVAPMKTLRIDAGRTDKLRPGDIVGALTGDMGLKADAIGAIKVFPTRTYIAIARAQAATALARLREGRIKNRKFRVQAI